MIKVWIYRQNGISLGCPNEWMKIRGRFGKRNMCVILCRRDSKEGIKVNWSYMRVVRYYSSKICSEILIFRIMV